MNTNRGLKIVQKLLCVGCALIMLAGCDTNSGKSRPEKIAYLVERAFIDHKFTGNALVVDNGEVIYSKSFGKANAESGIPNSDSTKFLIASLSKPFTATIILKLVEQGKLDLTSGLATFFGKVTDDRLKKVTIHHLLTHTSGIREFISDKHKFEEDDLIKSGFNFDPGSDFEYLNSGYILLKEIAEISSGKSYRDLLSELIFDPLEMTSAGVASRPDTIPNVAIGYTTTDQTQRDSIPYSLKLVDGAGSLFATTSDLAKFNRGLNSENFLSKRIFELMFSQHVERKFGYGWFLRERGGIWDVAYHKGDLPGYTSFLSRRTGRNQMILLLSNASNLDLPELENAIAKVLKTKE